MPRGDSLQDRLESRMSRLSPATLRVARYFATHREEALIASAAELAARVAASDATVVRTAKALGYSGLDALRRGLAEELRRDLTPAARVARTIEEVTGDPAHVFDATLKLHLNALERLRSDVSPALFQTAIEHILEANRLAVFGIGPSSALAEYFVIQIRRFGMDAIAITDTGLLLADALLRLQKGDLLLIMAYGRVYPELRALFDHADHTGLIKVLVTDTLGSKLGKRTDLVLRIPRGRADMFSMHTATLAFLEILLVGVAARRPQKSIESLRKLNRLRAEVTGIALDL